MRTKLLVTFIGAVLATSAAVWAQDNAPPQTKGAVPQETQKELTQKEPTQKEPAAPPAKEPAPPPSVTVIGARDAHGILGREVRSASNNENMGRIVDVIVDRTGTVRAAVIDFGGFLGVGSRKIVVDWSALHFSRIANKGDTVTLELNKEQVTAAPEYKEDTPLIVLGAAGKLSPWEFDR
ncbi:PRC-barrel domain-containing protein [Bradyrhizobium lablabi]|uniref:PRC-barrel domain-containing protein n=1 Tax=Bradyrhizobium lablabi TaxID=722472 RepID=UPI001BA9BE8E|nr:PRC-barrel domain-containing protein [Bradyrhizobium lablabi]MBR1123729.1 PRC-barrel domain-containing protein [Bradyrhizobium lablabi]